jgi:hypothetical protein
LRERLDAMVREAVGSLRAPDSGPATSAAAARNLALTKGSLRYRALAAYERGDCTDEDVGERIEPVLSRLRSRY